MSIVNVESRRRLKFKVQLTPAQMNAIRSTINYMFEGTAPYADTMDLLELHRDLTVKECGKLQEVLSVMGHTTEFDKRLYVKPAVCLLTRNELCLMRTPKLHEALETAIGSFIESLGIEYSSSLFEDQMADVSLERSFYFKQTATSQQTTAIEVYLSTLEIPFLDGSLKPLSAF